MEPLKRLRQDLCGCWRDDSDDPSVHLEPDEAHRLLADERRRHVIECLAYEVEADEKISVRTLAKYVAARENSIFAEEVPENIIESVYITLFQRHLTQLEEANVVRWDRESETVAPGGSIDGLAYLIEETRRACVPARYLFAASPSAPSASGCSGVSVDV